jgi:hypothetical protein
VLGLLEGITLYFPVLEIIFVFSDNVKSEMIKGKYSNVSSSIENRHRDDSDKFVSLAKRPEKTREKQNNDMDYQTMTENVRKFAP